ncbi:MAG: hypothetical protein GC155_10805 [Alphaproteobacteria bacterium]|nr:hypothetical protein [Alphaproteobacteria bacterium]
MKGLLVRFAAVLGGGCLFAQGGLTETPSPPKSVATLTVVYEFKGSGEDIPASHERHLKWAVADRYEISATMPAEVMSPVPGLHKSDGSGEAQIAQRQASAQAAAKDMAPMMAAAQAAAAKCGDDEACLQREVMKMAQGVDPNSAAMKNARANGAAASVPIKTRYQAFNTGKQTGSYTVDESAHQAYFDAACSLRNETPCAYDTTIKGAGKLTDSTSESFASEAHAEIDYQAGTLMVVAPFPGYVKATKTVTSAGKGIKTGTEAIGRRETLSQVSNVPVKVTCGECRSASGTFSREIDDALLGEKGVLTAKWTFTRK